MLREREAASRPPSSRSAAPRPTRSPVRPGRAPRADPRRTGPAARAPCVAAARQRPRRGRRRPPRARRAWRRSSRPTATRWQARSDAVAEREAAWEAVREEESELRVAHARAEAARRRGRAPPPRRARGACARPRDRDAALEREATEHRDTLAASRSSAPPPAPQLQELFAERDRLADELRALDENLGPCDGGRRGARGPRPRAAPRRRGARRGTAPPRARPRRGRGRRAQRPRTPRGRVGPAVRPARGTARARRGRARTQLRAELQAVAADIERLGPINMLAVEEHEEESKRLEFLIDPARRPGPGPRRPRSPRSGRSTRPRASSSSRLRADPRELRRHLPGAVRGRQLRHLARGPGRPARVADRDLRLAARQADAADPPAQRRRARAHRALAAVRHLPRQAEPLLRARRGGRAARRGQHRPLHRHAPGVQDATRSSSSSRTTRAPWRPPTGSTA